MEIIKPRTLSGFMELLPAKQIRFEKMVEILRTTYASYGFAPLDTPVIEDAQILLAKGGGETEKQIYRFTKGDSDLALRFDLTVPLAKYVALHCNDLGILDDRGIQRGEAVGGIGGAQDLHHLFKADLLVGKQLHKAGQCPGLDDFHCFDFLSEKNSMSLRGGR